MKNEIIKRLTGLIALLTVAAGLRAQVAVEQRLDSMEMFIGEQVNLTLRVSAPPKQQVVFPPLKNDTYLVPGVEILEQTGIDTVSNDARQMVLERRYTLTSFDDTLYLIPPLPVEVAGRKYTGKALPLKVMTLDVDTLHPEQFYPPKSVQDNPFSWNEWQEVFFLSFLAVLLVVLLGYLYLRLKDNKPVFVKLRVVRHVPPHQKAMEEIERIKAERLNTSENQKEYYTRLTDTIRTYLQERFGIHAMNMTGPEIIARLQKENDREKLDELRELFETADLVKFAKYATLINENDRNLTHAITFINQTKSEEKEQEVREAPQLTETQKRGIRARISLKTAIVMAAAALLAVAGYIVWQLTMLVD